MQGTIIDMLAHGASVEQIVPGIFLDPCHADGAMTNTGWTQQKLRDFLDFAGGVGVVDIAIWTDWAMGQGPYP